jgi:cellobiose dehydrogenase (acceptor)
MVFDQPGVTPFEVATSSGQFPQGWAQSQTNVLDPSTPDSGLLVHDNGMGVYVIPVASAVQPSYTAWVPTVTATPTTTPTTTPTAVPTVSAVPVPSGTTYDYVVIGGGAGGIPIADRLSEAGYSVLLIEKGPPTSGRWGGGKYLC